MTIFSGVPLSPNYEHTVYYPDGASLRSALRANFNYYSSAGLSYVRVTDGTVKIDTRNANVIDNYNYIEIKNPGAIYIYGFISAIKYITITQQKLVLILIFSKHTLHKIMSLSDVVLSKELMLIMIL